MTWIPLGYTFECTVRCLCTLACTVFNKATFNKKEQDEIHTHPHIVDVSFLSGNFLAGSPLVFWVFICALTSWFKKKCFCCTSSRTVKKCFQMFVIFAPVLLSIQILFILICAPYKIPQNTWISAFLEQLCISLKVFFCSNMVHIPPIYEIFSQESEDISKLVRAWCAKR